MCHRINKRRSTSLFLCPNNEWLFHNIYQHILPPFQLCIVGTLLPCWYEQIIEKCISVSKFNVTKVFTCFCQLRLVISKFGYFETKQISNAASEHTI